MKYLQSTQDGFSLVETLVAISILLIVIVGPMSISVSTARSTSYASEQVVAFFLAQEGAEMVQKARDDLLIENFSDPQVGWDEFIDSSAGSFYDECFSASGCGLELDTSSVGRVINTGVCSGVNCVLSYDSSANRQRYKHSSGVETEPSFTRVIKLSQSAVGSDDVRIISQVTWRTGSQRKTQEVVVESYVYNVYGN